MAVHLFAFREEPAAYLKALWWRLRRKRVRARAQFAPLLGRSPKAYALWLVNEERAENLAALSATPGSQIVALVQAGADPAALDATLRSLSAGGIKALPVGTPDMPDMASAARYIDWTEGAWILPIAAGDEIASGAREAYLAAIGDADVHLAYADDDLLDEARRRTLPHFKPDWNRELFQHFDFISGSCVLRVECKDLTAPALAQDWMRQLVARAVGRGTPRHVRKVLHHRRSRPGPSVSLPTVRTPDRLPLVSIIVPTRNRVELLRTCLKGIAATDYSDIEVIVMDNDSDDPATLDFMAGLDRAYCRVIRHAGVFNYSAINNRAVHEARGQLVCLLNNDIEIVEPDWLKIMVTQALRGDVGAVGARLLYPDGRIQHAGVVVGVGGAAAHAHRFLDPEEEGYFRRHALPQFTSAVTAACLVVKRDRYLAVGGLNECDFAVAFNDVDLCMRLNQRGWQSFYEPRATLIHHESASRGFDLDPVSAARLAGELAALKALWNTDRIVDQFHHPELSRASERFVVKL